MAYNMQLNRNIEKEIVYCANFLFSIFYLAVAGDSAKRQLFFTSNNTQRKFNKND